MRRFGVVDEAPDRSFVADVDRDTGPSDVGCNPFGRGTVEVGDDDVARARGVRRPRQRFTDPGSATRDDDHPVVEFHAAGR